MRFIQELALRRVRHREAQMQRMAAKLGTRPAGFRDSTADAQVDENTCEREVCTATIEDFFVFIGALERELGLETPRTERFPGLVRIPDEEMPY